jgi:hypothetical protein
MTAFPSAVQLQHLQGMLIQLAALGFPPPGHAHWTAASLHQVAGRYPELDLSEYEAALPSSAAMAPLPAMTPIPAREGGTIHTDGAAGTQSYYWVN